MSLPIACSLSDSELQERRGGVLQRVRRAVVQVKELETGYAYGFPADGDWLTELAKLVEFEHQCCPFLRFSIIVEPDNGSIWLENVRTSRSQRVHSSYFHFRSGALVSTRDIVYPFCLFLISANASSTVPRGLSLSSGYRTSH